LRSCAEGSQNKLDWCATHRDGKKFSRRQIDICGQDDLLNKAILFDRFNLICPSGKSLRNRVSDVSSPFLKIFWFSETANQLYIFCRPVSLRGAARDVTDAGRDAVDAAARLTGVACSGRRRCVVLMPRRWHQVGG
jgi:hypothetical protein